MRARGGSAAARRPQLIIGPWAHGNSRGVFAERTYGTMGSSLAFDLGGAHLRWFDHHLCGIDNGVEDEPAVRLFVMGPDVWRDEADWPLPDTQFTAFHLRGGGRANTSEGDGGLTTDPAGNEPADVYVYDPRDPAPTVGGGTILPGAHVSANAGPRDQTTVEARADVLCYTSDRLEADVEVTGPVTLLLFASSSARDTDFTGKLVDVHPDGRAEIATDGILRARYRESAACPELLVPGRVYELHIDLGATARIFPAGHRIRLEVSSSNFPRFDRNTNTGGRIAGDAVCDFVRAVNRVYHDTEQPSRLILPIIDRR
jgi:putative CocE/NonD family hydrolase